MSKVYSIIENNGESWEDNCDYTTHTFSTREVAEQYVAAWEANQASEIARYARFSRDYDEKYHSVRIEELEVDDSFDLAELVVSITDAELLGDYVQDSKYILCNLCNSHLEQVGNWLWEEQLTDDGRGFYCDNNILAVESLICPPEYGSRFMVGSEGVGYVVFLYEEDYYDDDTEQFIPAPNEYQGKYIALRCTGEGDCSSLWQFNFVGAGVFDAPEQAIAACEAEIAKG